MLVHNRGEIASRRALAREKKSRKNASFSKMAPGFHGGAGGAARGERF
jgi:hypothetical protein